MVRHAAGDAPVEVPPSARLLVVGASGAGKTTWVRGALAQLRGPSVFLDTKGERETLEWARRHRYVIVVGEAEGLRRVRSAERPRRLLVRCLDPLGETSNDLLEALYHGPPTTAVVDEAMHWSTRSAIPRGMRWLITAGRGRQIGVWACSQRPVEVSNFFLSESTHRVLFKIELEDDRLKIAPLMALSRRGAPAIAQLERHHWLWKTDSAYEPLRHFGPVPMP